MAVLEGLFDERFYLKQNPDAAGAVTRGEIAAENHFLLYGQKEGRAPGPWFNVSQYLHSNPDVRIAVDIGDITALQHFVEFGASEGRAPLHYFKSLFYLQQNPDVANAVEKGLTTASQHFIVYGLAESRIISPAVNLGAYLSANPDVELAVEGGAFTAMDHLLWHGLLEGRDLGNGVSLAFFAADAIFQNALTANDVIAALERLDAVAPFLPSFVPPRGWAPAADMEIPVDFVPPPGIKLVIPDGVVVPPGLVLPEAFEPEKRPLPETREPIDTSVPDTPDPIDRSLPEPPDPGPTFLADIDPLTGAVRFGGTAMGDISLAWAGVVGASVAQFTRDGKQAVVDFSETTLSIDLDADDVLAALFADLQGITFIGPGTVRLTDVELSAGELLDMPGISANLDASAVASIAGTPSEIHAFDVAEGFIKPTDWTAILTAPVSVAEANAVDALDGPGVVKATIVETDIETLKTLKGTGNAYSITVAGKFGALRANAVDLNALDAVTTVPVNATAFTAIQGNYFDVAKFISAVHAGGIDVSSSQNFILNEWDTTLHEQPLVAYGPNDILMVGGNGGANIDLTSLIGFEAITLQYRTGINPPSTVAIPDGAGIRVEAIFHSVIVQLGDFGQHFFSHRTSPQAHTVFGGPGDDTITGGPANDLISGGAGADVLTGGAGADVLTGDGAPVVPGRVVGDDIFVFAEGDGNVTDTIDEITDFLTGNDTIKTGVAGTNANYVRVAGADGGATRTVLPLSDIVEAANARFADLNAGGTQYAIVSNANTNAQGAAATFSYLLIDWDGDNTADHAIKLTGLTDLSRIGPHHIVE